MLKTNKDKLVMMSIAGMVAPPLRKGGFRIDRDGVPFALPGTGGITYNVKVGDLAFGWAGDHVEPCVSAAAVADTSRTNPKNQGFNILACVGNEATVISGDAKGAKGVVTGMHGGIEHVIIDFADEDIEKMTIEDKILIKSHGQGLKLLDYPAIALYNLSPDLLERLAIKEEKGSLVVPVAKRVPGKLMGSGIGAADAVSGDYDITTSDQEAIEEFGLDKMRFGDLVALEDCDTRYGRSFRKGALTIGVVVHSDCFVAGHGPGVTTLFTAVDGKLKAEQDENANLANILQIGRCQN